MSHLLASVNPEAADAIGRPADADAPDVGTWVVFKGRAGFSRMHRSEFAALVLSHHDDGTLELMVVMEPEDMMVETRVPFQSHNQPHFCWRYRRPSNGDMEAGNHRMNAMGARLTNIEQHLSEESIGEDLEQIDARLKSVELVLASDEVEALEKRIEALEKKTSKGK